MLLSYEKGAGIAVDIVCHMEYFYNTLDCHLKCEDPFRDHEKYPALLFKTDAAEKTLYEKHKQVIFPNSACK